MQNDIENLKKLLIAFDCSNQEIVVFMKLFRSIGLSISELSERSGLERNKCYRLVDELLSKELVVQMVNKKIKTYQTKTPSELASMFESRIRGNQKIAASFKQSLKNLNEVVKSDVFTTKISYFQKNETKQLLDDILYNYDYKGIFDPTIIYAYKSDLLKKWYSYQMSSTQKIKELVPRTGIEFYNLAKKITNPNYNIRMLDEKVSFPADFILYDQKIYLASYKSKVALVIEDDDLYEAFNSVFDSIWKQ